MYQALLTESKKIGVFGHGFSYGGHPVSAAIAGVMIPESMYQALLVESKKIGTFGHGFTYGGHPVSAAVALKALEIYARDHIVEKAAERGSQFQTRLKALGQHPLVGEARGLGLIGGLELVADKKTKRAFAAEHGVGARAVAFAEVEGLIVRSVLADVLTLSPPLVISDAEVGELFDRLARALDKTLDWVTREQIAQS
jgi:4-aminobutyrate--pyruvate transaminase